MAGVICVGSFAISVFAPYTAILCMFGGFAYELSPARFADVGVSFFCMCPTAEGVAIVGRVFGGEYL